MLVAYYPKAGQEEELLTLVRQHWPVLSKLGLVSDVASRVWRATDKRTGRRFILELFEWRDDTASERAHQLPQVMQVWEPMGALLEDMQFTKLEAAPSGP
jgi:hypothetical protein